VRRGAVVVVVVAAWLTTVGGCAHAIPAADVAGVPAGDGDDPGVIASELRGSVDAVVDGGWNLGRLQAVKDRTKALSLPATSEGIDWFTLQENVVVEVKGQSDELVYVVAHYDKVDANPLVVPSLLLNGLLDPAIDWSFMSEGAVDNATGVAVALSIARAVRQRPLRRTLRVLLVGAEESGLRGSRAHAARLTDDEWRRLAFVVNIDGVGIAGSGGCVTDNVSDPYLVQRMEKAARHIGVPLSRGQMPAIGASDYAAFAATGFVPDVSRSLLFNLTGALLPQRSYFAMPHQASVVNLMACEPIDVGDLVASLTVLPVGSFHGPRDHRGRVDLRGLVHTRAAALAFLREMDRDLEPTPSVDAVEPVEPPTAPVEPIVEPASPPTPTEAP
jgi:hypothetical protein